MTVGAETSSQGHFLLSLWDAVSVPGTSGLIFCEDVTPMTVMSLPPSPMTAFPVTMGTLALLACSDFRSSCPLLGSSPSKASARFKDVHFHCSAQLQNQLSSPEFD